MKNYAINTKVKWKWGKGYGDGKIVSKFTDDVCKTIKGTQVTRKASKQDPAYLIQQENEDEVLKSHSELEKT